MERQASNRCKDFLDRRRSFGLEWNPSMVSRMMVCLLLWCAPVFRLPAEEEKHFKAEQRLAAAVMFLASDKLEGRGVGTDGLDRAAQYIADEFAELGLQVNSYGETPFQTFQISAHAELGPSERNHLVLVGPPETPGAEPRRIELKLGEDFNTLAIGGSGQFDLPLVFVGYGITGKAEAYDDYAAIDVKERAVLMLRREPQQDNAHSVFDGSRSSQHALFTRKIANAYEHGAAAVIMVNDDFSLQRQIESQERLWSENLDKLSERRAAFSERKDPTPVEWARYRQDISQFAKRIHEIGEVLSRGLDTPLGFLEAGESSNRTIPVFFCSRNAFRPAIEATFGGKDFAALEREIDDKLVPQSAPLTNWRIIGQSDVIHHRADVKNVVAVLAGEGALANETVIVGAHYDHLGLGGAGSLAPWTKEIHNGADDNASGVAGLLEIARNFATGQPKPRRRIVFIAFTAEERGLLGSARYVREPRFSLENTVAMINLDMIGRLRENKLIIQGKDTAVEFDALIDRVNQKYGLAITKRPGGHGPSDHASFYAKRIPVLHIFTGTHSDYHRPSDDFDKINVEGMRIVTDLVTDLVASLAAAEKRPEFRESKQPRSGAERGGDRPYFGSIPDFSQEVEGYALMGVTPAGPAERAGLKAGDVIVQFGSSRIGGLEDFDSALRKFQANDEVPVTFRRDGKTMSVVVRLDPPR